MTSLGQATIINTALNDAQRRLVRSCLGRTKDCPLGQCGCHGERKGARQCWSRLARLSFVGGLAANDW